MSESKNLYDYFLEDLGRDSYQQNDSKNIKLLQFNNIYQEYQKLQEKFDKMNLDDNNSSDSSQSNLVNGLK